MKNLILSIDGMTCSACSNGLEKYLNKQNGIFNASVNLVMANATVTYDEKILNQEIIEKYVKQAGFKSLGVFKELNLEKNNKKEKQKFIIFTILAIILMYIAMGHMINLPIISFLDPHHNPINYTLSLQILTITFLIYGFDILKNGYKNLIHKIPNMDTLVSIGVISSFIYSLYGMYMILRGNSHFTMNLYFESSAIIIYFVKLGRYIDGISKDKTKEAIQKLTQITPNQAIIEVDGVQKQVTLDEIKKGDIVISKAGDKIAVDGEIIEGSSHFDESFITGESKPVAKAKGEKVIAGSLNFDGFIKYNGKHSKKYFNRQQEELGKINGFVQEMTAGQKVEKVFNHEEKDFEEFCRLNENFRKESTSALTYAGFMIPVIVSLSYLNYAVSACIGGIFTIKGIMDLGSLSAYLVYVRQSAMPLNQFTQQINFHLRDMH